MTVLHVTPSWFVFKHGDWFSVMHVTHINSDVAKTQITSNGWEKYMTESAVVCFHHSMFSMFITRVTKCKTPHSFSILNFGKFMYEME
jgi:hypothetical protein